MSVPSSRTHILMDDPQRAPLDSDSPLVSGHLAVSRIAADDAQQPPSRREFDATRYIKRICDHATTSARDSLYQGQDWTNLARWLSTQSPAPPTPSPKAGFAWIYMLDSDTPDTDHVKGRELSLPLQNPLYAGAIDGNALLFMRGYPGPDWVSEIGAYFKIDPEVFYRHLTFFHHRDAVSRQLPFIIPSSQISILHLTLTTVGRYSSAKGGSLSQIRSQAAKEMEKYLSSMRTPNWRAGNSVVRSFDVHNESIFSLEQLVTVYVSREGKEGGWTALVWLDSGDDISESPPGPWTTLVHPHTSFLLPVGMYRRNISLKGANHKLIKNDTSPVHGDKGFPQSVSLLPLFYGRSLNAKRMSEDSFYALHEIFQFWAASEIQFLNLVNSGLAGIDLDFDKYPSAMLEAQNSLKFYKNILDRHVNATTNVLQFMENRDLLDWPRSGANKPAMMAEQLYRDARYLVDKNHALQEKCTSSMTILMNTANLREARNALAQTERVYRLTLLAFIFIPLTFCTSIFGMNFVTFERSITGGWTLIVVTLPISFISLVMFNWNEFAIRDFATRIKRHARESKTKDSIADERFS